VSLDATAIERATGWCVEHHESLDSTNDRAGALRAGVHRPRVAVVADRQLRGRGREGRTFHSPPGGLYVSLLLAAPEQDLPARLVALCAVAAAEAIEAHAPVAVAIKWPNDLWVGRHKVGGILLEAAGADLPVIAGIGLNLGAAPGVLDPQAAAGIGGVGAICGRTPSRHDVLVTLLQRIDHWQEAGRSSSGGDRVESAWQERLALVGERVHCIVDGRSCVGVLEAISLSGGLLIRGRGGAAWQPAAVVQDLRPENATP
jgi:BirA family biotin operon repressor/biotin-[acetyl-CoA-carboxylase] ligase